MMSYKTITLESYQATAEAFARNVADLAPIGSIDRFISLLPPRAKIIDIGCGSGRDAAIFTSKQMDVLGIDLCPNLIDIAKTHAPLAQFQIMDIEKMALPASSFDGAWAACSLLHLPKMTLPSVLSNIHTLLKENGYFYLTLKKGSGEVLERDLRYGDFMKFWSFYEEEELRELIQHAHFNLLECCTVESQFAYQPNPCLRVFCQKLNQ